MRVHGRPRGWPLGLALGLAWTWLLFTALALLAAPAIAASPAAAEAAAGEAIYRQGRLPSGAPLRAHSPTDTELTGAAAACVNCHRRSGLGGREGRASVPPVAGRYLFQSIGARDQQPLPFVAGLRDRSAYDEATLARAIRSGLDADGRTLGPLMPRYALDDSAMAALVAYLNKLDATRTPGIGPTELHLATIVTPDTDPLARKGMLDVLRQFFADQNAVRYASAPVLRPSGRTQAAKTMFRVHRQWVLHVWQLEGPPETWGAQLDRRLAREPVFAVLSGLAGAEWAPVHDFCERAALPCLFPNVDAPPAGADADFYSAYFTRGVGLEADLIAADLAGRAPPPGGLVQVYRSDDAGAAGARALRERLAARGLAVRDEALPAGADEAALAARLQRVRPGEALALWLRPRDLAAATTLVPAPAPPTTVYVSGQLGGQSYQGGTALRGEWRRAARIALAADLPERSRVRVDFALGWFTLRRIPIVAPRVQVDTYLACGLLSETMNHLADVTQREYLLERMEEMLEHRVMTGPYPRLALARGQRFASKGGYLLRFDGADATRLAPVGDWTVP